MRFVSTLSVSNRTHPLLSRLGRGLLPLWLRGKRRQHHYRLQIRCEDRADMEQVLDLSEPHLQPAGLQPQQSLRPGRSGGRSWCSTCTAPRPSVAIWCSSCIRWGTSPGSLGAASRRDPELVLN